MSAQAILEWESVASAALRLGVTYHRVRRLADRQQVRTMQLPGGRRVVAIEDIERLRTTCVRGPALAGASS